MKNRWLPIILILLVGLIAYHNCFNNEMFWDDDDFILKNRYIKDWKYFPNFFSENLVAGGYLLSNYWRPFLLILFAWAWHTWELWLPGWHAFNVFFHLADGILIYFLMSRLFNNRTLGFLVGFIFTIHPVHNEAVVYVNSCGDSIASFFVLSCLLLFARFRDSKKPAYASRNFYFSCLLYPMAILSKETGFLLCGLLPTMDFLILQKDSNVFVRMRKTLQTVWPFLAMGAFYMVLRGTVLNFNNSFNFYGKDSEFANNIFLRIMTFFKASTQYAGFFFIPYELRVERQMPFPGSLFEPDVLFGGLIIMTMVVCVFKYWRAKPLLSFGFAWFFIAIAPASNVLVPINSVLYEHFLYMPMVGLVLVLMHSILTLVEKKQLQKIALGVLAAVTVTFCAINIHRTNDWKTAIGFYEQLVKYSPSYRVINNLGMEYADKGIHDKAEYWYNKAIEMDPTNPVAYHNIAGTYRDTGRMELAEKNFKKVIELNPKFIFSYRSLAELYYRMGRYEESLRYLRVVVNYDPEDKNARDALATVQEQISRLKATAISPLAR